MYDVDGQKDVLPTDTAMPRRAATASAIGFVLEDYDFFLYGLASALVFGQLFFPTFSPAAGTLAAFATFFVGFAARPIGGIIFGHFGDKVGRKRTLITTLTLMGVASTLIGLLPTYETIGLWAPIALVMLRCLQGIALGGDIGGAFVFGVEHAPVNRRGFYGGIVSLGAPLGLALVTLVLFGVTLLTGAEQFLSWGWRVPFLLSAIIALVGLYIRLNITESPAFQEVHEQGQTVSSPLADTVRNFPKEIVLSTLMYGGANTFPFYIATLFMVSYATNNLELERTSVLSGLVGVTLIFALIAVAGGALSDRIGRRPVFIAGSLGSAAVAFPGFWLADSAQLPLVILAMLVLGAPLWLNWGTSAAFFSELYEARVRYTGVSLGIGLGSTLGATAPLLATALLAAAGGATWAVALSVIVASLISAVAAFLASETRGRG